MNGAENPTDTRGAQALQLLGATELQQRNPTSFSASEDEALEAVSGEREIGARR